LGDRVRVTGFIGATPSLQFVGRSGNVSDLFGEKLSEAFVATAIDQALAHSRATTRFVLLAPDQDESGWRYTLYVEGRFSAHFAETLDAALSGNPHYRYCRKLGQLSSVRVFAIAEGGYETFLRHAMKTGARLGEIKPAVLSRASGWSELFVGDYVEARLQSR
jgi:hypothetical protein